MPATFTTAPFGASEPVQHGDAARPRGSGRSSGCTTVAVGRGRVEVGQVLGHGLAGDGEAVAVEQPGVEQLPHHDRHAADAVEVDHVELAVRLRVGDVRHPRGDPVEVVELEVDPGLVRRWRAGAARRWSSRRAPSSTAMAFSNASLVMIWRGPDAELEQVHRPPRRTRRRSRRAGGRRPGADAEPGSDMPMRLGRPTPSCWR